MFVDRYACGDVPLSLSLKKWPTLQLTSLFTKFGGKKNRYFQFKMFHRGARGIHDVAKCMFTAHKFN